MKSKKVLGIISGFLALILILLPLYGFKDLAWAQSMGYLGFFLANYFGFGLITLPLVLPTLNPFLVILVGSVGLTIDEFFAWYAGYASEKFEYEKKYQKKISSYVEKYGLRAIFILGLLPLHGIMYAVSGFAAGHYKIPFYKFFLANWFGKLIRTSLFVLFFLNVF